MTTKPLCWVPYYSLELTPLQTTLCCKMNHSIAPTFSLDEYHSDRLETVRDQLFKGPELAPVCAACAVDQPHTRRKIKQDQWTKMGWTDPEKGQLRDLQIALDNVCASSCIPCNPNLSTTIANYMLDDARSAGLYPRWIIGKSRLFDLDKLAEDWQNLEVVHVFGGEPLLSPQWPKFVEIMAASPKLKELVVNTGLKQIKPQWFQKLVDLPRQINIQLLISMDAPLEYNNWIRGCSEQEFLDAYQLIKANKDRFDRISYQAVIAAYNVFSLPDWIEQVQQLSGESKPYFSSSTVWDPVEVAAWQLPDQLKADTVQYLTGHLTTAPDSGRHVLKTALELLKKPATVDWTTAVNRMELLPRKRGNTTDLSYWIAKYLKTK